MTEKQKITQWFKTHKTMTVWQAVHLVGSENPRSRVSEMPEIGSRMIDVINQDGVKTQVAQYFKVAG